MNAAKRTAVVAFVPVIHKGYVDLFAGHDGDIFIWGDELIKQFTFLTRDLRILGERGTLQALKALFPDRSVSALTEERLKDWGYDLTIMPEDESSNELKEKYFPTKDAQFVPVFLRWNRIITFKEHEIDPLQKITTGELHRRFMRGAQDETPKSSDWWRQVGAMAVKDGSPILQTHNRHLPTDHHLATNGDPRSNFNAGEHQEIYTSIHAEADLIAQAAKEGISLKNAELYCTTFPCPNCARLIVTSGIRKVYYSKGYSLFDAKKILDHFGVEVILVQ